MKLIQLNKTVKTATLFICLLFSSLNCALEVNDLYQSKVEVKDQSLSERRAALRSAMKAVLLKVGGKEEVLKHPLLRKALTSYNSYINQFHYDRNNVSANNPNILPLSLVASFNEEKINQLFLTANLPIWGRLRPQILVWIVNENGLSRDIIADSAASTLPKQVLAFSKRRGLPLNLPLMDLEDATQVSISDIWGRFSTPVQEVSQRYLSDAVLVVRISNSSLLNDEAANNNSSTCELVVCTSTQSIVMDWSLISNQQSFSQSYIGQDKTVLLEQILSDVTETVYQRYALSTDTSNSLVIDVANIGDLTSFVHVMDFLVDLSSVDTATLLAASGDNRRIELTLLGSKQALLASLALNKQLKQYIDPLAGNSVDDIPVFYWGGK